MVYIKINSVWVPYLNIKAENIKLKIEVKKYKTSRRRYRGNLLDLGMGNDFLAMTQKH